MSYRVVIPTAGTGSRLEGLTKYVNKSLVGIANRPTISHLIEQFPSKCEFVIVLGYKGKLVRDFLELAYPDRTFYFAYVEHYEGEKSGLGMSLLSCEEHLQQPFVFLSCDTLVKGKIPEPNCNWMGFAQRYNLSEYRTLNVINGKVLEVCEKGVLKSKLNAYIGIAGIHDYKEFWKAMQDGKMTAINQGESYGLKAILKTKTIFANQFEWFDTGNLNSIKIARKEYSQSNEPNILEKENEAIWFIGDTVIKYSDDENFIANRVKRVKELKGFVPRVYANRANMYCYKKIEGAVLSDEITLSIFEDFLEECKEFWIYKSLSAAEQEKFQHNCMDFYKDKTLNRVDLFYKNFNKEDNANLINGMQMPLLADLLEVIDWKWISEGIPGRYHGDFHFENIIYSKVTKKFTFLDWRQDFSGDLSVGDIYYDLAKLMHGLIINHGIIASNKFNASWKTNHVNFQFNRKKILVDCEKKFEEFIVSMGYDLKKVRVLTALIYLNIAALHHYPYSILLYGLGKEMLKNEIVK
jgi:choline kinase